MKPERRIKTPSPNSDRQGKLAAALKRNIARRKKPAGKGKAGERA